MPFRKEFTNFHTSSLWQVSESKVIQLPHDARSINRGLTIDVTEFIVPFNNLTTDVNDVYFSINGGSIDTKIYDDENYDMIHGENHNIICRLSRDSATPTMCRTRFRTRCCYISSFQVNLCGADGFTLQDDKLIDPNGDTKWTIGFTVIIDKY